MFVPCDKYTVTGFDALREGLRVECRNRTGNILALQHSAREVKVLFDGGGWGWYPCRDVQIEVEDALPTVVWEAEAADMGLTIRRPSDHQVQFLQDGKVLADWWPGKGTTMMDGKRGPRCATGDAVIAWLKTA